MKTILPFAVVFSVACYAPHVATPPASFTQAALTPPRPTDTAQPLAAVVWALNYDLRDFESVWSWLHTQVPAGPERARAIAAATLIAVAELDRDDLTTEGLAAYDEAIPAFPDDARLPLWRAYIVFLAARDSKDPARIATALDGVRATTKEYPAFTLFGLTIGIGGWEDATPEQIEEARKAFDAVVSETYVMQHATSSLELDRLRRLWDTPIAPYGIPGMQAMIGDLALRAGKKDEAARAYYTALNANGAARWPWRAEVQRRLEHMDDVMAGFAARPATEFAIGSRQRGAIGMANRPRDDRFGGRVGNGSCTACHTHVSSFDSNEPVSEVGWVRIRVMPPKEAPHMVSAAFLLPDGENPIPGGFGIGPFVDSEGPRDFPKRDELYDGTFVIPAKPGTWFVAAQSELDGVKYQGYLPRELGKQWFLDVKAGQLLDVTDVPVEMRPMKQP